MEQEQTIIVYAKDSVFKFKGLFVKYLWEIDERGCLMIMERGDQGVESIVSYFRNWDYFTIERESLY